MFSPTASPHNLGRCGSAQTLIKLVRATVQRRLPLHGLAAARALFQSTFQRPAPPHPVAQTTRQLLARSTSFLARRARASRSLLQTIKSPMATRRLTLFSRILLAA